MRDPKSRMSVDDILIYLRLIRRTRLNRLIKVDSLYDFYFNDDAIYNNYSEINQFKATLKSNNKKYVIEKVKIVKQNMIHGKIPKEAK